MKNIFYLIGLLLILIAANLFSCSFLDDPFNRPEVPEIKMWTVSGTTIFDGTPGAGTTIKLAAFFADGESPNYTYLTVSNAVTATDEGAFSLDIDASNLKPVEGDDIYLRMWEDDNLNNEYDSGEISYRVEPAPGGCPVFGDANDIVEMYGLNFCSFSWREENSVWGGLSTNGWNVVRSDLGNDESVYTAVLTGARITNHLRFANY